MSTTPSPRLTTVIVTYASEPLIRSCLDSVLANAPSCGMKLVVVDNSSPDRTVEIVRTEYPTVEVIARSTNDGFAVANNRALRDLSTEYVLVLNPDTRIEAGTLDHLIASMDADATIGVMGCRLLTKDGTLDHAAKRSIPSPLQAASYFALRAVGRTGSGYVRPDLDDDAIADVDAINGAFMLIRAGALSEVGLLDENYWMYGEDLDWCVRFRAAGWRVVYDGSVIAHHLKGGCAPGPRKLRLNYHFHRSMAVFYLAHQRTNIFLDAVIIAAIWSRFALTTASGSVRRALSGLGKIR